MSDDFTANRIDTEKTGKFDFFGMGYVAMIVFALCWFLGVYSCWQHFGAGKAIFAILVFTVVFAICGIGCGWIANAIRTFTMPSAFFNDGSIMSVFKTKIFWNFVPQSIGIGIGFYLALELMGVFGFV